MDPWSKADYSRHIREAVMVVEKLSEINPPSGRVPVQVRLEIPIFELQRRWYIGEYREKKCLSRIFVARGKYRPKGGTRGGPLHPGGLLARPGVGPRHLAVQEGVAPLPLFFGQPE